MCLKSVLKIYVFVLIRVQLVKKSDDWLTGCCFREWKGKGQARVDIAYFVQLE